MEMLPVKVEGQVCSGVDPGNERLLFAVVQGQNKIRGKGKIFSLPDMTGLEIEVAQFDGPACLPVLQRHIDVLDQHTADVNAGKARASLLAGRPLLPCPGQLVQLPVFPQGRPSCLIRPRCGPG
jgi:hypothetical protein